MSNAKPSRCPWANSDPLYIDYHDQEWGVPVRDDRLLFEFLLLEGAQAGLSWLTVLRKRENYRKAFDGFNPEKVARYDSLKIESLLINPGIIRNRLKVTAAVQNAKLFLDVRDEYGSFCDYIWRFVDGKPIDNRIKSLADIPASTDLSDKISKDLKNRGFKFAGSTIIYAHMQATGMVNDHLVSCPRHKACQKL